MSVYKRTGAETYSYDFRFRGSRFSGSTDCTTKREAEKFEEAEKRRLKATLADLCKPMTWNVAASYWWNEKGQFLANASDAERDLAWLQKQFASKAISDIGDREIAAAVAKRRGEGVSNATVNRTVTQPMRAILRRARRTYKQTVQDIEWKDHMLPEAQERVREASSDEEARFMAAVRGDYAPALRFAILTGCRRAEIVGLEWHNVNFFTNEFTVLGKGERRRTIPMTGQVRELLWELRHHHRTKVFTYAVVRATPQNKHGARRPITMEGFKTQWRRTAQRAKVEDFRFHDLRHTAATRLVRATGNLKLAQKLLGHTELATTSRYSHVTTDDLRAGLEAATPTKTATDAHGETAKKK